MAIATGEQATAADVLALALKTKLLTHTRVSDAASGDVSYTSYGFQPKALIIFAVAEGTGTAKASWGFGDENLAEGAITARDSGANPVFLNAGAVLVWVQDAAGDGQTAVLKTLDADGFTLTWTKNGGGSTQNAILWVLALR